MRRAWTVGAIWIVGVGAPTGSEDAREVVLQARPAIELASASQVVDDLRDGDVLRIRVEDGVSLVAGFVQQCLHLDGKGCFNSFPVQFDADGEARFQYQIHDRPDRCGPAGSCVVVVTDGEGERSAVAATVFGGAAPPPPEVTMTPAAPYQAGDVVRVDVTALTPHIRVGVAYCGSRCGRIASSFADPTGAASARITIGANCRECHIVVSAGFHRVAVPVEFDATHYDWRRLGAGILLAATLLIVAWRLIAAVDWRPPSEADAPELDAPDVDVAAGGGPSRPSI